MNTIEALADLTAFLRDNPAKGPGPAAYLVPSRFAGDAAYTFALVIHAPSGAWAFKGFWTAPETMGIRTATEQGRILALSRRTRKGGSL